jgi:hypothetical protein
MPALGPSPSEFRRLVLLCAFAPSILLIVAAGKSADQINPDAVICLRTAQYYRSLQWCLAINGYWGPIRPAVE